jgi:predicted MFS family arabinose efflux permease
MKDFLTNKMTILLLICLFINRLQSFKQPVFTPYLVEKYDISEGNAGLVLTLGAVFTIAGAPFIARIRKIIDKRYIILGCYMTSILTTLLFGPIAPESFGVTCLGVMLTGFIAMGPAILSMTVNSESLII